jgi:hypothetical protein
MHYHDTDYRPLVNALAFRLKSTGYSPEPWSKRYEATAMEQTLP